MLLPIKEAAMATLIAVLTILKLVLKHIRCNFSDPQKMALTAKKVGSYDAAHRHILTPYATNLLPGK